MYATLVVWCFITFSFFCSPLYVQDGQTALFIASKGGRDPIVELLLRRDANVNYQNKVRHLMLRLSNV